MFRHNKQIVSKALTRITKLKLSQAFGWWRHQAAALQDARARAGQIIACMQNQCMAAAFHSWVNAVTDSKEAATRRSQLVDAAVTRSNATLLGQMFVVRVSLLQLCGLLTYHRQTAAWCTSWLSAAVTACYRYYLTLWAVLAQSLPAQYSSAASLLHLDYVRLQNMSAWHNSYQGGMWLRTFNGSLHGTILRSSCDCLACPLCPHVNMCGCEGRFGF